MIAVHVQMVARIEAYGRLIESFRVIEMAVTAEQMQMPLRPRLPLRLQIARAVAEPAAAVEHDVMAVRRFDPHARRPAAVHARLQNPESIGIARERLRVDGTADDVFDRAVQEA